MTAPRFPGRPVLAALLCGLLLFAGAVSQVSGPRAGAAKPLNGDVVLHPALLLMLYGGDPFLAANVEAVRVTTSGRLEDQKSLGFFVRLHGSVARLNPCHEDNYYITSAFLPWGGAVAVADDIIEKAGRCRFWDPWPMFMFGFNRYFFARDSETAIAALKEASSRSKGKEAAFFNTLSVSFRVATFDDTGAAKGYLAAEVARTKDPAFRHSLERRIKRIEGLSVLREAQAAYQKQFGRALGEPKELLTSGILKEFPKDPLGLGYDFRNGRFELKQVQMFPQGG